MNAKRMLNISGILNTLVFPLTSICSVFVSVHTDYITQLRERVSHRGKLQALTPAWKPQRGNKCVSICVGVCVFVG